MNGDFNNAISASDLTLTELVEDPLICLMMKSDGVERSNIEALFTRIAQQRSRLTPAQAWRFCLSTQ